MGRVDVEMLEDGSAAVCWVEGEKAKARVLARRIAPDGKKGPLFAVADVSGARGSGFPQMVTTDAGFMFAWTEPTKPSKIRLGSTRVREPKYRRPPWKVTKDPR
jgi:hypothetical protein